jgi:hypothetical protein
MRLYPSGLTPTVRSLVCKRIHRNMYRNRICQCMCSTVNRGLAAARCCRGESGAADSEVPGTLRREDRGRPAVGPRSFDPCLLRLWRPRFTCCTHSAKKATERSGHHWKPPHCTLATPKSVAGFVLCPAHPSTRRPQVGLILFCCADAWSRARLLFPTLLVCLLTSFKESLDSDLDSHPRPALG